MIKLKMYDTILQNPSTEAEALKYAFALGMVFDEVETTEQDVYDSRLIATIEGIGVYYNWKADYYAFADLTGE